jgi:arylsulfatase A-like enzyme
MPTEQGGLPLTETLLPEALSTYAGYKSYALGKWNLGHSSVDYLPTSRGFDYYLGSLTSENTYWTKSMPEFMGMKDFFESTPTKFGAYQGDDLKEYSTYLYRNHAKTIIQTHDFNANPMFLYLSFQAAHPPFEDLKIHTDGLTEEYFTTEQYNTVLKSTSGFLKQQYTLSIMLLDAAVQEIIETLTIQGQLDNTYIIFTSDNGGCPLNGGYNSQLRGTKGTLFEGKTLDLVLIS